MQCLLRHVSLRRELLSCGLLKTPLQGEKTLELTKAVGSLLAEHEVCSKLGKPWPARRPR